MNQLGPQSLIGRRNRRPREAGIALIAVMLILALVSVLAVSSMESTMRDQQVAGVQMRDRVAFQAAEAGLAQCFDQEKLNCLEVTKKYNNIFKKIS